MRTEYKLFVGLGLFMLPLGIIYLFVGHYTSGIEIAGTIMLLLVAISFAFIGIYLLIQSKRMNGLRPEDYDASPEDGAGEVGAFPAASIWPLIAAAAVTTIGFGLVFSTFICIPGLGLLLASVIGMARESEISGTAHEDIDAHNHVGVEAAPTFSDQVKK